MKKLTSIMLCLTLIASLFILPAYSAEAQANTHSENTLFSADYDILVPTPVKTDTNTEISASADGNALKILGALNDDGSALKGGAFYSTKAFTHGNAIIKMDVMRETAGYHLQCDLWDSTGTGKPIRINMPTTEEKIWYTYIINPITKVAYRKEKAATTWETAEISIPGISTSDAYTNTLKIGSGSGSANSKGIWHIDNVTLYADNTAISVIMPADITKTHPVYVVNEEFEKDTNIFTIANGAECNAKTTVSLVDPDASSDNTVYDINLSSHTTWGSHWSTYYKGMVVNFPSSSLTYNVSLDFRRLNDDFEEEAIGITTGGPTGSDRVGLKIPVSQFEKNEWYTISYTISPSPAGTLTLDPSTLKATKHSDGSVISLSQKNGNLWSSSLVNRFTLYPTVIAENMLNSDLRKTSHYQVDDIKVSYETSDTLKTELITPATSGTVLPMIAAYDENGVLLKVKEGTASAIETISTFGGTASCEFDIFSEINDFANAKTVKVLYWDELNNAKAYAPYAEIGDAISKENGNAVSNTKTLDITSDMLPEGATDNYTVLAYAVSFAETSDAIPAYDSVSHKLLALDQFDNVPAKITYDASLYDGSYEDIVVVINANGSENAKKTLVEEVNPPSITNIVMQLGANDTQRNFTWFSLRKDEGKITYAKAEDMIDGALPADAKVIIASRDTVSGKEYSLKDFYYNNKATITDLEPDTLYYYQLSNGASKTKLIPFTTSKNGSSFSFAFGGDAQVGGSEYVDYAQETTNWARSIRQMATDPAFDGIEFFISAGDQVDSCDRKDGSTEDAMWDIKDEQQYDIYTSPEEFLSLPQVITYGNHDPKTQGRHYQHFNPPNMPTAEEIISGSVSGASSYGAADKTVYPQSADHYFTYKSALFICLNGNGYASSKTYNTTIEANNKAFAEKQAEFVKSVTDKYKNDPEIMWTIVLYHQSPYGSSYHGNYKQTVAADGTITFGRSEQQAYIDMRKYLMPALDSCDVDMILSGHDHVYTRTHIIKPATDENGNYTYADDATVTPFADNSYTYADGTTTPKFNTTWKDSNGVVWSDLQVKSKPVKVTNPDGILHITGASSSGSQVNNVEYTNRFTVANAAAATRHMSKIDITPSSLTIETFNLGTDNTEKVTSVDKFTIERTADVDIQGINLPKEETVAVGLTKNLDYRFVPAEPTINTALTWSSDNTDVATVENGVITGIEAGTANITVTTENGKSATCKITVVDKISVTTITVPESITMEALTTKTVTATIAPDNTSIKTLKWTSSDETVATVNSKGSITAHKHGNAIITATATDGSNVSARIKVEVTYIPSTVNFAETFTMVANSTAKLNIAVSPENATFKNFTWASSDESVVSVDKYGNLLSYMPGTAEITATTPERVLTCTVTVKGTVLFEQNMEDPNNTILYDKFYLGEQAWTRIQDEDGNWILDMDHKNVTKGFAGIKNSRSESPANTIIMPPYSGYTVDFDFRKISETGLGAINFRTYDQNGTFSGFKIQIDSLETNVWYDIRVITPVTGKRTLLYKKCDSAEWIDGTVLLLSNVYNGSSTISSNINYMDIMAMFINKAGEISTEDQLKTHWQMDNIRTYVDVPAESFALDKTSATITVGETYSIMPVFTPSDVTDNHVAYTTSDSSVATVDRFGKIKAIKKGTATITAASSATQTTSTFTVTVLPFAPEIEVIKTDNGETWKFDISTKNTDAGEKIYIAAYNSSHKMLSATSDNFIANGNTLLLSKDENINYFKIFIWGNNNTPCIEAKLLAD